jgi:16S rRNA (cytosine1402-N4)-methyltransferase
MMAGSDGTRAVAGGLARHVPVLGRRVSEYLQARDGGVYIDGTFGAGGHTRAILEVAGTRVIGIDRDQSAVAGGFSLVDAAAGRLVLVEDRFANLDEVARGQGHAAVDGVLLDLGVSSMQLDQGERGFSFRHDGPLDMRMGGDGPSAADVVARASERDLSLIISTLGEERFARPVARAIVKARDEAPIDSTRALCEIIGTVLRQRAGEIHPATRTFQALRIVVNDELGELVAGLAAAESMLKAGGRLVVISFHSLEDRIVKTFFAERATQGGGSRHAPQVVRARPSFRVLTRRPVIADEAENAANPRARSAKLRAGERTDAAPLNAGLSHLLPRLPALADIMRGR